jgi:PEP-CTERM motif
VGRNSILNTIGTLAISLGLASAPEAVSAATLLQSSGILTGVHDVVVDGLHYDVTFVDGSCSGAFGQCDAQHFTFLTDVAAAAGATALRAALERPSDFDPAYISGCGNFFICDILIPYGNYYPNPPQVLVSVYADNGPPNDLADDQFTGFYGQFVNTTDDPTHVWAVWAPAASVPEPATWTMLLVGFGMLGGALRFRRDPAMTAA